MEKKKLVLSLNKEIVANLNKSEMTNIEGGQASDATTCIGTRCGESYCLAYTCGYSCFCGSTMC